MHTFFRAHLLSLCSVICVGAGLCVSLAHAGTGEDSQGGCSNENQGLTTHHTFVTTADPDTAFVDNDNDIFATASVPDVLKITKKTKRFHRGDLLLYFSRGGGLCLSVSEDHGVSWSTPEDVVFNGLRNGGGVVDPSAIQLRNGKIRLFFYGPSSVGGDPAQIPGDHIMYSAVSKGGRNFTVQSKRRFADENITDPEIVRFGDLWLLYMSQGQSTRIASSTDGKTFTDTGVTWSGGGIPGAIAHDGVVDLYGCAGANIMTARSTDGIHFGESSIAMAGANACDPAPVKINDSTFLLIYKKVLD